MSILINILKAGSVFSLAMFILLGILVVGIQTVGIITLNGTLIASVGIVKNISIIFAGIVGVGSFILSYVSKKKKQ